MAETLFGKTGIPVIADNDANIAALGEVWKGSGKDYKNAMMITLGTGIGGGIISNGKILHGFRGVVGEVGHLVVTETHPLLCTCGRHGCLQQYSSAKAIADCAMLRLRQETIDSVLRTVLVPSAKDVCDAAKAGDILGKDILDQACCYLGKALAQITCIVTPDAFIIGGGMSKAGPYLLDLIEASYREHVFHASRDVKFVLARLGNDAGIYGAAKLFIADP